MSVSFFFSILPKYGLRQERKNLKMIIILSSSFTKILLSVPIENEVFANKVPQLFVTKLQPNHLFLLPENGLLEPVKPQFKAGPPS